MKKVLVMAYLTVSVALSAQVLQNNSFQKSKAGWDTRKYWGGEVSLADQLLVVKTTNFKNQGRYWGRALGKRLAADFPMAGKSFKITADVKGKGDFFCGFLVTVKKANGKNDYKYIKSETPEVLTGEFRKISCIVTLENIPPVSVVPFVEVQGENNAAYIRSITVEKSETAGITAGNFQKKAVKYAPPAEKVKAAAENIKVLSSDSFKKNLRSWSGKSYWGGKVSKNETDMVLTTTDFKGRSWCRVLGVRPRRTEFAGRRFRIRVTAKGSGDLYPGFLITSRKADGKADYSYLKTEKPFTLDEKYRQYTFDVDLGDRAPLGVTPFIELQGKDKSAFIRLVRMEAVSGKDAEMSLNSLLAVVPENSPAPAREFKFSKADATVQTLQFPAEAPEKSMVQPEISDNKGIVKVPVQGNVSGLKKIIAAAEGAYAAGYALGIDKKIYDQLDAAARKVKAGKPLSILYLGDSLNDFDRGYNSVDQAAAFLEKYNPGKFKLYNYSVAGDYITRVEERFNGKRADKRFDGIFDNRYDLVIIALGNNDTRATSAGNYDNPLVPVAEIRPAFERVIAILRKENPGVPVWLLSASRSDSERMVQKSDAATAKGRLGIRFGIAKHAENFNKAVQETVAAGKDLRYVDIYTPMSRKFDPENYADGVHLSLKGHHLFAELLLKAFAQ